MRAALLSALAVLALSAAPALAQECTEVDAKVSRAGVCVYEPCTLVWVDPLTQLQDEGIAVEVCTGEDTSVCYAHARRYECVV